MNVIFKIYNFFLSLTILLISNLSIGKLNITIETSNKTYKWSLPKVPILKMN